MSNYMAIIHKEPNGWYSAEVPALPGCYTDGATLDEIHFNLKEAIQLYLQDQPGNVAHDLTPGTQRRIMRDAGLADEDLGSDNAIFVA